MATVACDDTTADDDGSVLIDEADAINYERFDVDALDATVHEAARLATTVVFPSGEAPPATAVKDSEELQLRFAHALLTAMSIDEIRSRAQTGEAIEIHYTGVGAVSNEAVDFKDDVLDEAGAVPFKVPERYADGARWMAGFNGETHNEFEVRVPADLGRIVGSSGRDKGIDQGWSGPDGTVEASETEFRGLVGPNDTRTLRGSVNTAQTTSNFRKLVGFTRPGASASAGSVCTGTMVGPHHVVTVAHCLYSRSAGAAQGSWNGRDLRVGRNGTDWIDSADTSTGSRWFWIEAAYKAAKDANPSSSPRGWDFGVMITPTRDIGATSGWFAWGVSNAEHDDMLNRGYPATAPQSLAVRPRGHLYGDSNNCETGDFSNATDGSGKSLFGYHTCDTTGGQSGSPLYRLNNNGNWVVRGVHKGARNPAYPAGGAGVADDLLWNSFTLVTQDRADWLTYWRAVWP